MFRQAEGAAVSLESPALFDFGHRQLLETTRCAHLCKPVEPILLQHFARLIMVLTVSGIRVFAARAYASEGQATLLKSEEDDRAKPHIHLSR